MCRTPHWVPVPESSERGRPAHGGGFDTPAVPLPDVPLPHLEAATFLEVAPVQTQTLTQPETLTDEPDAEADVLPAVPPQNRLAHHPETEAEPPGPSELDEPLE